MTLTRNIAAVTAVTLALASGCSSSSEKKVILEVTGPATADVTYGITADQSQELDVATPWKKELTSTDATMIVVITAQSKSAGVIFCKITIDGKVVKENKSSGEFAVVTCTSS